MRLKSQNARAGLAGITLIECLVYLAVFSLLLGLGTAAFFLCLNHTKAVLYATSDIEAALRAGECWRADVRAATGTITVETTGTTEFLTIPEVGKQVTYRFANGELRRQTLPEPFSQVLLPKVVSSQMQPDVRGRVTAWRWELQLSERRHETHLPLLFSFEAVPRSTP